MNPAPQGSKVPMQGPHQRFPVMRESCKRLPAWRKRITAQARLVGLQPVAGAVTFTALFLMHRPKSHLTASGALRKSAPRHPTSLRVGDLSKLIRAVEDSLTDAGCWDDDSCVCATFSGKRYCRSGEQPGVHVLIEPHLEWKHLPHPAVMRSRLAG